MLSFNTIQEIIKQNKNELYQEFKVQNLGVFGSYARGEQNEKSDIDILVEFEETPDLFSFLRLEQYLENCLNIKVDLVRSNALRKELKGQILEEVIYV